MDGLSGDLISILQYLLPGFLSAWVFHSLTSYPKASQFERVVQALIFTLFVQVILNIIKYVLFMVGRYAFSFGDWDQDVELIYSTIIALLVGVGFSYAANTDKLHTWLRNRKITRETSYPSEWFGAFLNQVTYVVLHLKDERRLYGWPVEWPSEPGKGHFLITQPCWLVEGEDIELSGVENILIDVNDVKWVEFMEKSWEANDE